MRPASSLPFPRTLNIPIASDTASIYKAIWVGRDRFDYPSTRRSHPPAVRDGSAWSTRFRHRGLWRLAASGPFEFRLAAGTEVDRDLMAIPINLKQSVVGVNGAGRGIGREYVMLLASRGAGVVVNDVGGPAGTPNVAEEVVGEIAVRGGAAVESKHDVSMPDGGQGLCDLALERYGRIDAVIHNAGVVDPGEFGSISDASLLRLLAAHYKATFYVGQPAWRQMLDQGYGRIVLTASGAIFGEPGVSAYAGAKSATLGLASTLTGEARRAGVDILTNVVAPMAATRIGAAYNDRFIGLAGPDNVAALGAYLASPQCFFSGKCFRVGRGFVGEVFLGMARGWASMSGPIGVEDIADNLSEILLRDAFVAPESATAMIDAVYDRLHRVVRTGELGPILDPVESRVPDRDL
jgi:NAD(P)-dependent dehydrogenase (short-subunit alcohol dehydrogenase family)